MATCKLLLTQIDKLMPRLAQLKIGLRVLTTCILVSLFLIPAPIAAFGQTPSGIIDPVRYINWSTSGVVGGIPTVSTACGAHSGTIASSTNITTLNTDISDCVGGGSPVVLNLGAGTFTLAGAPQIRGSNLVIRGQGPSTILNITATTSSGWPYGAPSAFQIFSSTSPYTGDLNPGIMGVDATTIKTWTGTNGAANVFTQGATVFNLSSTSGLTVGDELACWQTDDPDGSVPASTLFVSEKNSTGTNDTSWVGENADKPGAGGGGLAHRSLVTNISGSGVTVADPLVMPTGVFQTARTAQCGWLTAAKLIKNVGLENMTIQTTSLSGSYDSVVSTLGGYNVWMTGVVLTPLYSASFGCTCATDFGFDFKDSIHSTVLGNWINQMHGGGTYTTTSYGVATEGSQWMRVENNIFNGVESPIEIIFASVGNAYLFNFTNTVAANGDTGVQEHSVAVEYNLVEGNSVPQFFAEDLHGNGHFTTLHRNYFRTDGIDIWSYHRWYNIISNVIVAGSRYETKSTDVTTYARGAGSAYRLGFPEQYGSAEHWTSGGTSCTFSPSGSSGSEPSCVPSDSGVWTSSFRWKNYDSFTGTTKYDSSEVPTAGTQFTNAVPASHTDPASYVYSVSPSWWPNKAWPIIGADDVSGGAYEGGRVYKTPAQDCFEAAGGVLGSYSGTTSASFAYSTCYNGSGAGQGGGTTGTPGYGTGVLRRMRPLLN